MKQVPIKFDKWDRARVIDAVQEHYGVKLEKIGRHDKWLRDESSRNWWVLGAVEDWHGISKDMMADEKQAQLGGMLIIAERKLTSIEVFAGPLSQLVSSRDKLYALKTGAYQFTVKVRGDLMKCVQAPAIVLKRIISIPHSDEDREREQRMNELAKAIAHLTPEELKELLEKRRLNEASP